MWYQKFPRTTSGPHCQYYLYMKFRNNFLVFSHWWSGIITTWNIESFVLLFFFWITRLSFKFSYRLSNCVATKQNCNILSHLSCEFIRSSGLSSCLFVNSILRLPAFKKRMRDNSQHIFKIISIDEWRNLEIVANWCLSEMSFL